MSLQRRVRRRSSVPDPRERLRALAPGAVPGTGPWPPDPTPSAPVPDGSYAPAPCPPAEGAEPSPPDAPAIPSAPYAVAAPEADRDTETGAGPNAPAGDAGAPLSGTDAPTGRTGDPPVTSPSPEASPWAPEAAWRSDAAGLGAERSAEGTRGAEAERRDRTARPPSGYEEIRPEPPGSLLARIVERWPAGAAPSRRAVLALTVLGLIAVGAALLALRDRPEEVTAEAVAAASPAGGTAAAAASGTETGGADGRDGTGAAAPPEDLVVHVGGKVAEPGLYTVPAGSRVADAVARAGGALPDTDLDTLNLARPLVDGEQVLVGVPAAGGAGEAAGAGGPVNINRADVTALTRLPRVGEVIAAEIVAHRETHGPFASVDALVEVNGIGDRTLETLRPHVTVG
ncbi:ComEA family DNA-binding protein [Nocardiopsis sp. FIRDI 009]|uniref:ComEA family DNA-binding protein n=1 Tax=Nocardiopsis sp. FIRDI 009 TaxID=714197 RepID=UPI000E2224D5|nr:ComEA family DNA-binding protein [Nocardiopsis sp. FIRDI 009]